MNKYYYWIFIFIIGICIYYSLQTNDEVKLGNNYAYDSNCHHITGEIDIPPVVISYKFDNRFIVAKQSPTPCDNVIYDKMEYNYYLGRDTIYYWIIDKQTGKFYGPIDYNQYDSLLKKYTVLKDFLLIP